MRRTFDVIGLGRFGSSECRVLNAQGMDFLAIDSDEAKINEFRHIVSHAVIADATDEKVLKELGIRKIDHVIVGIGENIQASILITLILKEFGVKKVTEIGRASCRERV